MKKYFWGIVPALAIAALYAINHTGHKTSGYLGDADAIGTEADANERLNYEWAMLRDPVTGIIPAHIRERELEYASILPGDGIFNALGKSTAVSWDPRGPWNVGGRTRALAIDVSNENILLAGSCSGGMWRSTDQGATWSKTSTQTQPLSVSCIAQDTRSGHTNTWYYGSGEAYGASASATGAYYLGNGIYKSTDGGLTWNVLPATFPSTSSLISFDAWADLVWNVATDASNSTQDEVYAAAVSGVYRSVDGGTTWNASRLSSNSYFTDLAVSPTGVVYATFSSDGAGKGIFRSTDGITWTNITPAGFPAVYNRVKIGICPDDETQVYFVGNTPGSGTPDTNYVGDVEWNSMWKYNYVSGDGSGAGGLWNDLSSNLPTSGGPFDKFTTQGSYDIVVKVKPGDTNTVFLGGTCLYRSTSAFKDNTHTRFIGGYQEGATLPVVNMYANHHPDQHELVFLPSNPNKMISTNDGGIFMTNDNTASTVAWNSLNNGYITTMFYTCALDHATTNDIVIGGAQDNGSWYTNNTSLTSPWVTPRGGDGSYCAIADNGGAYYFSIQSGKIMKAKLNSAGGVDSFARIDPIGVNTKDYLFINPFVLDPNNNNIMYLAGGKHLWRNNDLSGIPYASNWDSISTNWVKFTDSVPNGTQITAIAVSKTPANRVYYGTSARLLYRVDNANTTPTVTNITSTTTKALFPSGANISSIAVDPNNADNILVSFSNYSVYSIFYSTDGGATWAKAAGNLETSNKGTGNGPSIRWVSIMPVTGGTVYLAGTSVGLFATTELADTNTVWFQQGASTIGNAVVDMIDYRQTDGLVVVATHSHGIYSGHITQVADINSVGQLYTTSNPTFTAYPNPFSGQATISYDLPQNNYVSLKVYDMTGRLVRVLADGQQSAGNKKVTLAGSGLAPGVYLCTLQTGDKKATRQVVVQ